MSNFISSLITEGVVTAWHDFRSGTYVDLSGNGRDVTTINGMEWGGGGLWSPGPGGDVVGNYATTDTASAFGPTNGSLIWCGVDRDAGNLGVMTSLGRAGTTPGWQNHVQMHVRTGYDVVKFRMRANNSTLVDVSSSEYLHLNTQTTCMFTWGSGGATGWVNGVEAYTTATSKVANFDTPSDMRLFTGSTPDYKFCMPGTHHSILVLNRMIDGTEAAAIRGELMS